MVGRSKWGLGGGNKYQTQSLPTLQSVFEMGSFKVEATQHTNKLNFRGLGWRERERPAEGGDTLTQWRK